MQTSYAHLLSGVECGTARPRFADGATAKRATTAANLGRQQRPKAEALDLVWKIITAKMSRLKSGNGVRQYCRPLKRRQLGEIDVRCLE
jgi:hypothetical protein